MKNNGIRGKLLSLLSDFLDNRYQRILLNGKTSEWAYAVAGVPQGFVLGPLMFLLYIKDIIIDIKSDIRIFADDVSLFQLSRTPLPVLITSNMIWIKYLYGLISGVYVLTLI